MYKRQGVTAYSENGLTGDLDIANVFATGLTGDAKKVADDIISTSGFADLQAFKDALGADGKDNITAVSFKVTAGSHKAETAVTYSTDPKYPIKKVEMCIRDRNCLVHTTKGRQCCNLCQQCGG